MKIIQKAVRAYLQDKTGIKTVSDRTCIRNEYPLLAVSVQETGTVLVDGGRQAEHSYQITVTAAKDRERDGNTALLSSLTPILLRGIPLELDGERRVLHPLNIQAEAETLTFSLELCASVPPAADDDPAVTVPMVVLHFTV